MYITMSKLYLLIVSKLTGYHSSYNVRGYDNNILQRRIRRASAIFISHSPTFKTIV